MKLSRRDALRMCRKLWLWLAKNPRSDKYEAFKVLKLPYIISLCPCCEYYAQHQSPDGNCVKVCLLKKLWPNGCYDQKSVYHSWGRGSTPLVRTRYAMKIANACKEVSRVSKPKS